MYIGRDDCQLHLIFLVPYKAESIILTAYHILKVFWTFASIALSFFRKQTTILPSTCSRRLRDFIPNTLLTIEGEKP